MFNEIDGSRGGHEQVCPTSRLVPVLLLPIVAACGGADAPPVDSTGACRGVEVSTDSSYVAPGLCVRAVANDQGPVRQLTFAPNGDLLAARADGSILRYRDLNDDGIFEGSREIVRVAMTGGMNGNNAHLADGFLYAGSTDGVVRFAYSDDAEQLATGEDVIVGQPSDGTHQLHTVHVYDGWLYVHSGSADNAMAPMAPDYDSERATLRRFKLSDFESGTPFQWADGENVVLGVRNMVGFTQNAAGRMYGVVNGLDSLMYGGQDVHLDNPGDDLIRIEMGAEHGYPYCFTAQHIQVAGEMVEPGTQLASATDASQPDPDFSNPHDDAWCAEHSLPPVTFTPAHAAPLDIVFDDGADALPEQFRGGAFVALHGSWDTLPSVGHKIVFIPFDSAGNAPMPTADADGTTFPFTTVFGGGRNGQEKDGIWSWANGSWGEEPVRPVGVAISPVDGALYVSSDNAGIFGGPDAEKQGAIYRIRKDER